MNIFGKLFLSFVAAYLLSLAVTLFVVFPLWFTLQPSRQITAQGEQALAIYQQQGEQGLSAWLRDLRRRTHAYGRLVAEDGRVLPKHAPRVPRPFKHHFQRLLEGEDRIHLPHGGKLMAVTLSDDTGNTWRWIALLPPDKASRLPPLLLRLGIGILVLAIAAWLVSRLLTRPIAALRQTSQALARGELDARTPESLIDRGDELGTLAVDFNRMADRLQTLIESHQRLLRDVSHELRSPLARLQVALELARQRDDAEMLDRIELEANRLEHMLDEVLTLSRLQETAGDVQRRVLDFSGLIAEVVRDAEFEATQKNVSIESSLQDSRLNGDMGLLRRAVENVLRNAVQHSPTGSRINVDLRANAGHITLEVADQGPGAPQADLEKLFLPFHRVGEARDRESGGYGLGLAIASRAVTAHDGSISARLADGGGLVVTIRLPS